MILRSFVRLYSNQIKQNPKVLNVKTKGNITKPPEREPIESKDEDVFDREFMELKVDDYAAIHGNDESLIAKIKVILQEYEYTKYNSMGRVPSTLTNEDMFRLIREGTSPGTRDALINFMFKREMDKRRTIRKREREKELTRQRLQERYNSQSERDRTGLFDANCDLVYGLWHNSLFIRLPEGAMKNGKSMSRLATAAKFGPTLIFDFDFEDYMTEWVAKNTVEQVSESYGLNRFHYHEPFDLWFCNFKKSSYSYEFASTRAMPHLLSKSMITLKEDCFTNYFDKSRLVYLTPNAKETLGNVGKNNDVYIVGAYNDKGSVKPLTYRKAEKLGIRARSLPLDDYVAWRGSSKSLCINHVVGVLLEVMATGGDWQAALLKHIPERKIKPVEQVLEEEEIRRTKLSRKQRVYRKFNIKEDLDLF